MFRRCFRSISADLGTGIQFVLVGGSIQLEITDLHFGGWGSAPGQL